MDPLTKPPFGVTSAEVVINCPDYIAMASWCHVSYDSWKWVKHPEYPEKNGGNSNMCSKIKGKSAPHIRSVPHKHAFNMGFERGFIYFLLASTTSKIHRCLDSRQVSGASDKASTGNKSKLLSRLGHSSVTQHGQPAKLLDADSRTDQSQHMSESYCDCQKNRDMWKNNVGSAAW